MRTAEKIRLTVAVGLFLTWLALVAAGRAEMAPLVDFIKYTLAGLASHALLATPKGPTAP